NKRVQEEFLKQQKEEQAQKEKLDKAKEQELIEKKVQEALLKKKEEQQKEALAIKAKKERLEKERLEKALIEAKVKEELKKKKLAKTKKPKHHSNHYAINNDLADKSAFFAGLGYMGMAGGWNGIMSANSPSLKKAHATLNGFDVKLGYQYISKRHPHIGLRAGFMYAFRGGTYSQDYSTFYRYSPYPPPYWQPIIMKVDSSSNANITMNTYSFFMDFLNDFYQSPKFFIGWYLGFGIGGESVSLSNINPSMTQAGLSAINAVQFQGYGALGLRGGTKHHTFEVGVSIHGDAGGCSKHESMIVNATMKVCGNRNSFYENSFGDTRINVSSPSGVFGSYVTWSANYIYRF
uniref:outer membrane beta-barrel protein n=1 Tax=Helicobacter cetorum TaxID=138563 RepID=UPI00131556F0